MDKNKREQQKNISREEEEQQTNTQRDIHTNEEIMVQIWDDGEACHWGGSTSELYTNLHTQPHQEWLFR